MADPDEDRRRAFEERIAEDAPVDIGPGDASTSPEALKVLREQGVPAWREWVANQAAAGGNDDTP